MWVADDLVYCRSVLNTNGARMRAALDAAHALTVVVVLVTRAAGTGVA